MQISTAAKGRIQAPAAARRVAKEALFGDIGLSPRLLCGDSPTPSTVSRRSSISRTSSTYAQARTSETQQSVLCYMP